MLIYHFVDPGLRVETFFEKDEAVENGGVDFEIGDRGTSAPLYWRLVGHEETDSIWLTIVFSNNLNTMYLKLFSNHDEIYRSEKKSKKYSGEIKD